MIPKQKQARIENAPTIVEDAPYPLYQMGYFKIPKEGEFALPQDPLGLFDPNSRLRRFIKKADDSQL